MVTLFTSPSCTSCRKAKAWLEEHEIPYTERNIFSEPLNIAEIKENFWRFLNRTKRPPIKPGIKAIKLIIN